MDGEVSLSVGVSGVIRCRADVQPGIALRHTFDCQLAQVDAVAPKYGRHVVPPRLVMLFVAPRRNAHHEVVLAIVRYRCDVTRVVESVAASFDAFQPLSNVGRTGSVRITRHR
jgi:hypothetical protein